MIFTPQIYEKLASMSKHNTLTLFHLLFLLLAISCKENCLVSELVAETQLPSFAGIPTQGTNSEDFSPNNWRDCGLPGHAPPGIHPGEGEGFFGVATLPGDGETYLGLVVRDLG